MKRVFRLFVFVPLVICGAVQSEVVEFDMSDASKWNVIQDPDAEALFGFDYTELGIPEPPGGGDSKGIHLAVNIEDGAAAGIAVSPANFMAQGTYSIAVDVWMNFYADPGKVGTTEFAGVFLGTDDVVDGVFNGAGLLADTDGDTARDYRLYNGGNEVNIDTGQYNIESQGNQDVDLVDNFPGQEPPDAQTDPDKFDPPNEIIFAEDGTQAFAWHTWTVAVDAEAGTAEFAIDGLSIGTLSADIEDDLELEGSIALVLTDIFSSVAPVPEFAFTVFDNLTVEVADGEPAGDFNSNGALEAEDINLLSEAVRTGNTESRFDVNTDGDVDIADFDFWVTDLRNTWFGDANLDGEFSSQDFVAVFQIGEYEDGIAGNSGWQDGDWNGDGDFDSSDFVKAFQDTGFEQGPRQVQNVPEPTFLLPMCLALCAWPWRSPARRSHKIR